MFVWTAIPKSKKIGWGPVARPTKTKSQTHQLWNEAQLNCVALRSSLDYEVAWRPVKGQNERQRTAPLTALHATGRSSVDVGEKNMEGRHVGLDFYDLLIEALSGFYVNHACGDEGWTRSALSGEYLQPLLLAFLAVFAAQ